MSSKASSISKSKDGRDHSSVEVLPSFPVWSVVSIRTQRKSMKTSTSSKLFNYLLQWFLFWCSVETQNWWENREWELFSTGSWSLWPSSCSVSISMEWFPKTSVLSFFITVLASTNPWVYVFSFGIVIYVSTIFYIIFQKPTIDK